MNEPRVDPSPDLSIVIATSHSCEALDRCLAAVEKTRGSHAVETLVVTDSREESQLVREKFATATLLQVERDRLIPELWGEAVARSNGRVIALTTASFVPASQWIESILRAHADGQAAVGGAVENVPGSMVDWAIYFVRYSAFMPPFRGGPVAHILGENASYTRAAIAPEMEWIRVHGFWENEINAWLVSRGQGLLAEPSMLVRYANSFTVGEFARQRLAHGRIFGRMRAAKCPAARRLVYAATSPAIPVIYLARILRNVLVKKRNRSALLLSLPAMLLFLICWAAGEFWGLVFG